MITSMLYLLDVPGLQSWIVGILINDIIFWTECSETVDCMLRNHGLHTQKWLGACALFYILFLKEKLHPPITHVLRQVFSSQHPLQPQDLLFPKVFSPSLDSSLGLLSTSPSALPLFIAYVYLCPAVVWMPIPLLYKLVYCRRQQ